MAKQTSLFQPVGFNNTGVFFANADGTTTKDVIAAGANDSIITSLIATSTDTSAQVITLFRSDGSHDYIVGVYPIPALAGAGTGSGNPPIDLLSEAYLPLADGKRVLTLKTGWKVRAAMQSAVTATLTVAISATAQDY